MEYRRAEILIVDSVDENRERYGELLADCDANLFLSSSMADALSHVESHDVSALIISSDLSEYDGFQLINRMLGSDETRHIPIVLLLPHLSDEKRKLNPTLFAGVDHLYKPVEVTELRHKIQQLVQLHRYREIMKYRHDESEKLFKASNEGVLGIDDKGLVIFANAAAGRMLGATSTTLLGIYLETLLEEAHHKLESQWHEHPIYNACQSGNILQVKKSQFWRTDGLHFESSFAAVPVSEMDELKIVFAFKELEKRGENAEKQANLHKRDHLTQLPNRVRSEEVIEDVLEKAKQNKREMAVLLVNLDHFRYINEGLGHEIGDNVLIEVAKRLQVLVRGDDFVGRLGGDEFPIVLEHIDSAENAGLVAKKIIAEMAEPFLLDGHEISLGASVGIAVYPSCGTSANELLKNAAIALKRAKATGRNIYQYFTVEMNTQLVQWLRLEQDFRRAMSSSQLVLTYEKIVSLDTDVRIGLVPLLQWHHPEQGILDEKTILATADELGLLLELGKRVMQESLQYLYNYRKMQESDDKIRLFLEVYACQLEEDGFMELLLSSLSQYELKSQNIVVVLAEKALAGRSVDSASVIRKLEELGFKIAVKNFGEGYGSLALFNKFKFDFVQISEIYSHGLKSREVADEVLKSIISLSHQLGVKVVVNSTNEGSGDELRKINCDYVMTSSCLSAGNDYGELKPG